MKKQHNYTGKMPWLPCFVFLALTMNCFAQELPPLPVLPKPVLTSPKATVPHYLANNRMVKSVNRMVKAVVQPPLKSWLVWDESSDTGIIGYSVNGSNASSISLTNRIVIGNTNRVLDPGWLYVELRAMNTNGESDPAIGQRCSIARAGSVTTVSFVPITGRTNRLEVTTNFNQWSLVKLVTGSARTNIVVANQGFYRVRAL